MLIGYARVSTTDQTLNSQEDDLCTAGCERIFSDVASGSKSARPGLAEALDHLRKGDTLVVWRLDRLGRSLGHLIETVGHLAKTGRGFRSLREQIDTTTPGGKLVFHLFGALAEFEREVIRERTKAGLSSARTRGRTGGRPRRLDQKAGGAGAGAHGRPQQQGGGHLPHAGRVPLDVIPFAGEGPALAHADTSAPRKIDVTTWRGFGARLSEALPSGMSQVRAAEVTGCLAPAWQLQCF